MQEGKQFSEMCGKVCYSSEKQALTALNGIRRSKYIRKGKGIPKKCYLCPDCRMYHLTKRSDDWKGERKS